jgi:carbon storage regulator
MLNLTRRIGETIVVGDDVKITVRRIMGNQVELLIDAPKDIPVHRLEIYNRIQREKMYVKTPDEKNYYGMKFIPDQL